MPGLSGRGHRPCHSAALILVRPGAQSPRPAPAPPSAGASRPPGRALASDSPGRSGLQGTVARGRGNAGRVSFSRPNRRRYFHRFNGRGHRPCHSAMLIHGPPGAKAPGPAPAPPAVGAAFCCACPNARHGTVVPDRAAKTWGVSGSARNGSRLPRIRKALPCGSQSGCPSGTLRSHAPLRYCRRWPLTKRPFSLNSSVEVSVSSDPSTALANRPIIIRALIA